MMNLGSADSEANFTYKAGSNSEENEAKEKKTQTQDNINKREKRKNERSKDSSMSYFKLYRYANPLDKFLIAISLTSALICGAVQTMGYVLFGVVAGHIVDFISEASNTTSSRMLDTMISNLNGHVHWFAIRMSSVGLSLILFTYIANVLMTYSAMRQITAIRKLFLNKMLDKEMAWYDLNQSGDFASNFTDNLSKIEDGIGEKVVLFVFYKSVFVCGVIMALHLGWKLALVCLVSLPVTSLLMAGVSWLSARFAKEEMEAYSSAGSIAEEVLSAIKTVVAFEGQKKEVERYEAHLKIARRNNIKRHCFNGISNGFMWFSQYFCYAVSFWYGVDLILDERDLLVNERVYTPGNMIAIFTCTIFASMAFVQATPFFETFAIAKGAAMKIFSILESRPTINRSKNTGLMLDEVKGNIRFDNVHFEYPSRPEVKVLQGLTLEVEGGETVALVGSSGCGKSTCIQLIQRFYDPTAGNIYLDGKDIRDLNLIWLRDSIGIVNQEPVLFATTIGENIRLGKPDATQMEIENASRIANAHEFIMDLPLGYGTMVGERGVQLSGGQKQRIAIARALVKQPSILLLDEATSALDTTSEAEVQAALNKVIRTKTTIIVAHRLSTIRNADRIVFIKDGKIVEEGKHTELMTLKGHYYNLIQAHYESDNEKEKIQISTDYSPETINNVRSSMSKNGIEPEQKALLDEEDEDIGNNQEKLNGGLFQLLQENLPEMHYVVLGCISAVIIGASTPIYSLVFGDIVGVLSESDKEYVRKEANRFCMYFFIIGITVGLAFFLQLFAFGIAGEYLTFRLRKKLFASMLNQEMGWFDIKENGIGALCMKLAVDASRIQGAAGMRIGTILNALSVSILASLFGFYLKWDLTLVLLAFAIPIVISVWYEHKVLANDAEIGGKILEESTSIALEAISNIRTVISLSAEKVFYKKYGEALKPYVETVKRRIHFRSLIVAGARCLPVFAYVAGITYGVKLVIQEHMKYEIIYKVGESIIASSWAVGIAFSFSPNFQSGVSAAKRIFKLIQRVPKIKNEEVSPVKEWGNGNIKYSKVYFSYPTRPNIQVLNGLNLEILRGKTVALVGSSGCGKSTIIQLLERFYDPDSGRICVDNVNIKSMALATLRSRLGIVSQEPNLFDRSIAENIAYGANDREVTMKEIIEAAKKANVHTFVTSLPLGYETRLGSRGMQLSGGQKQRIAIARALIREPEALLLDEATSALDNESEKVVQAALDDARTGRTCIIIAHRLTTIKDADVICVIKDGVIVESGKHQELLEQKGEYYQFYKVQSGET